MAKTVPLRASRQFRYATRRLLPGDLFDAPARDARILIAARRAQVVREPATVPPPPAALVEKVAPQPDVAAVRAEYERVLGKRPFPGWGVDELRRRIAAGPDA